MPMQCNNSLIFNLAIQRIKSSLRNNHLKLLKIEATLLLTQIDSYTTYNNQFKCLKLRH